MTDHVGRADVKIFTPRYPRYPKAGLRKRPLRVKGDWQRCGKMLKNAQQSDRVKRGDRSAVNQRGTTPMAEAARQFEQLRQVEDELMNQYRYRQGTTGGHQSGVERVLALPVHQMCEQP